MTACLFVCESFLPPDVRIPRLCLILQQSTNSRDGNEQTSLPRTIQYPHTQVCVCYEEGRKMGGGEMERGWGEGGKMERGQGGSKEDGKGEGERLEGKGEKEGA